MFFTFAEKRKSSFTGKWQLRQLAFDTQRRHLYISDELGGPQEAAPPAGYPLPVAVSRPSSPAGRGAGGDFALVSPAGPDARSPTSPLSPTGRLMGGADRGENFVVTSPPPLSTDVRVAKKWTRNLLIDCVRDVRTSGAGGPPEETARQVILYGEERDVPRAEKIRAEQLLCASASLAGQPERYAISNAEYLRDPFFLRELHTVLEQEFALLRVRRDREREGATTPEPEDGGRLTIGTPRANGSPTSKVPRQQSAVMSEIVLRFRNDFEWRRFLFVVQTVLGCDKLCTRPYRGLPPYDPRNGVTFAQIPAALLRSCRQLEKAALYTFLSGDVAGYNAGGDLTITAHGTYLCVTHERVWLITEKCGVAGSVSLKDVCRVEYNVYCRIPYMAFLSHAGASELVFIPQPSRLDKEAAAHFNPHVETLRVMQVVRGVFFSSVDVRRAIDIREASEPSVRAFVARAEGELMRPLNFTLRPASVLPTETAADAWRKMGVEYDLQLLRRAGATAIPLYEGHPNSDGFKPEVLTAVEAHLKRSHSSQCDVVGMSERAQSRLMTHIHSGSREALPTGVEVARLGSPDSSSHSSAHSLTLEAYGEPGSVYLTEEPPAMLQPSAVPEATGEAGPAGGQAR